MDNIKNEKELPLSKRVTEYTNRITKRIIESIQSIGRPSRVWVSCSIDSPFPTLNGAEKTEYAFILNLEDIKDIVQLELGGSECSAEEIEENASRSYELQALYILSVLTNSFISVVQSLFYESNLKYEDYYDVFISILETNRDELGTSYLNDQELNEQAKKLINGLEHHLMNYSITRLEEE